jgi:hypothetical protein
VVRKSTSGRGTITSRAALAEQEDVLGQLALPLVDQALLSALAHERAQLVLGVRVVAHLAGRGDAERTQEEVPHAVEEVDDRLGAQVEEPHRRRHHQRGPLYHGDGQALGGQLADHDVQERDDQERDDHRHRQPEDGQLRPEDALEQRGERGLAEHAQAEAGHSDPELAGREVGVEMVDRVAHRLRPGLSLALELLHLSGAQPGDRELGGHEEAVGGDEDEGAQELEDHRHRRGGGRCCARPERPGLGPRVLLHQLLDARIGGPIRGRLRGVEGLAEDSALLGQVGRGIALARAGSQRPADVLEPDPVR